MIGIIYILNALAYGMLIALAAVGLSLIFGFMKIVNFAHGAIFMLGAYFALSLIGWFDSFWLALLFSPILVMVVGVVLERFVLNKISKRGEMDSILLTFGLALLIENAIKMVWGPDIYSINPPTMLEGVISIFGFPYPTYRLFVIIISALVCLLLYLVLYKTRIGVRIRAGTEDGEMASAVGINTKLLGTLVFAAGCGLAAIAGVVSGPYLTLSPTIGGSIIITSFIVIVIGGMSKIGRVVVSAIVVGFIETLGGLFVPDFAMLLVYIMMILVLINKNGFKKFSLKQGRNKLKAEEG